MRTLTMARYLSFKFAIAHLHSSGVAGAEADAKAQAREHFRREDDGSWRYRLVEAGGKVKLASGVELSVDAIYAGALELEAG